ncbi:MAG: DUF503 domain-containing protein [Caldicoprobacterales bacterium]|jgi:uncharacterized protein YlxP (DUF503 family)|nr:DUF503 domain-containing protein [Clostridiales bacterium]
MITSIVTIKLYASWIHSLKEKRKVIKSLCEKLRKKYNVSVIESDAQDIHQTIILSIAFLAGSTALADSTCEKICDFIDNNTDAEVADVQIDFC